ncbi:uncharacterized protein LOC113313030 [Papaver somniferum]|uniref:uncharacterized protein LOC113313030 n=1 Tax=Papaver somniferum TaxID=3469 RepID=UPI000E6F6BE9|nr:uncharacterized protein LOC113313030 [Papaver somniferum]
MNAQMISTGDNPTVQTHKGNQDIGLEDLGFIGHEHTSTNNNLGIGRRRSRIDMALGNAAWNSVFPSSRVFHLRQMGMEIAKACSKQVQGSVAFILDKKMQFTRIALSKWNRKHFGNINLQVDTLQQQLTNIQAQPHSPENTSKALEIIAELQRWHHIQCEFNKQKSIDNFLKYMDNNTKYSHTLTKRKRVRNNIDSLKDKNGTWLHSRDQLAKLLTENFQEIRISTNPIIEERFYNHIPTIITEEDNILLTAIPSNE